MSPEKDGTLRSPHPGQARHVVALAATVTLVALPLVLLGGGAAPAATSNRPSLTAIGAPVHQPETAGQLSRARQLRRIQLTEHRVIASTTTTTAPTPTPTTAAWSAPVTHSTWTPPTPTTAPRNVVTWSPPTTTTTTPLAPHYGHSISGLATWYGWRSGQCASPSLPYGTTVSVTNAATGASTSCTVTDHEASNPGRIIDLDSSVFSQIAPLSAGAITVTVSW